MESREGSAGSDQTMVHEWDFKPGAANQRVAHWHNRGEVGNATRDHIAQQKSEWHGADKWPTDQNLAR